MTRPAPAKGAVCDRPTWQGKTDAEWCAIDGRRLRAEREKRGMTREQYARWLGVGEADVARFEDGRD